MMTSLKSGAWAVLFVSLIAMQAQAEERSEFGACDWPFVSDPDTANIAYPDKYAIYWVSAVSGALPGTRFRIEGQYPDVRYFSFNVYDAAARPTDGIADFRIDPNAGGRNPFRHAEDPTGEGVGDAYTLIVETGAKPEERSHNTIYTGEISLPGGAGGVHNPQFLMIYRIYVPQDFRDPQGGVDLPTITQETADGGTTLVPFSKCGPFTPDTGSALNDAIMGADFPDGLAFAPYRLAPEDPKPTKFFGLPETGRNLANNLLANPVGAELPQSRVTEGNGGGFLSNVDNSYLTLFFRRDKGNLYVIKAKAPLWEGDGRQETRGNNGISTGNTRPTGRRGTDAQLRYQEAQLRYWSICTNHFETQRYVDCLADLDMQLDAAGYFTVVVSDAGNRPAGIDQVPGVNWLPWGGPYYNSLVIYRHMLPPDDVDKFPQAIQHQGYHDGLEGMGEYLPQAAYCSRETVGTALATGADVLAACQNAPPSK